MKKDIKKEWIAAILSAKELNRNGVMNYKGVKDPLGILCDIHRKRIKKAGWKKKTASTLCMSYYGNQSALPNVVCKWAGLEDNDPFLCNNLTVGEMWYSFGNPKRLARLIDRSL